MVKLPQTHHRFSKKTHLSYEPDKPKITLQEYYSQAGALETTPTLRGTYAIKTAVKFHIEWYLQT